MDQDDVSAGRLITIMFALMRDNAVAMGGAVIALSAVGVATEMANPEAYFSAPLSIATMVAEFMVMRAALEKLGLVQRSRPAVLSYVGASILANIGILIGLILLVIPGLVLTLRWSAALPIVLAEDQNASASLAESWQRTKGHTLQVLIAYLVPLVPLVIGLVAYASSDPETMQVSIATSVIGNVGIAVYSAMTWLLSVAIYAVVTRAPEALEEIFA